MNHHYKLLIVVFTLFLTCEAFAQQAMVHPQLGVGLRRSSYGQRPKNADDQWWVDRAKAYAAQFDNATPMIVQIVSGYQGDGSTQFGFAKPDKYTGSTDRMTFVQGALDHERALSLYDNSGVKAIIQFEPGDSEMLNCIEIAHLAFGHHPCVIGYGVDAEWYFTKGSVENAGRPIPDEAARAWMEKIVKINPNFTLFLKHWEPKQMPPNYRHDNLWFLSDSQMFDSIDTFMTDFKHWSGSLKGSISGYQIGYPRDKVWWSTFANPPKELGDRIRKEIDSTRYLFWVDFTAEEVAFSESTPAEAPPAAPAAPAAPPAAP